MQKCLYWFLNVVQVFILKVLHCSESVLKLYCIKYRQVFFGMKLEMMKFSSLDWSVAQTFRSEQ